MRGITRCQQFSRLWEVLKVLRGTPERTYEHFEMFDGICFKCAADDPGIIRRAVFCFYYSESVSKNIILCLIHADYETGYAVITKKIICQ